MSELSDLIAQQGGNQPGSMLNDVMGSMLASTINAPAGTPLATGLNFGGLTEAPANTGLTGEPANLAEEEAPLFQEKELANLPGHVSENVEDRTGETPYDPQGALMAIDPVSGQMVYRGTMAEQVSRGLKNIGTKWGGSSPDVLEGQISDIMGGKGNRLSLPGEP